MMKTTLCTLALKMLDATFVLTSVEEVLDALGEAVERAKEQLADAEKTADVEFMDAVNDEVCSVIEQLLGAAFVVCQASITRVVSRVEAIHAQVERRGQTLSRVPQDKVALMVFGCPNVGSTRRTVVAAINAFANYFKHESEWPVTWRGLSKMQKRTAGIVANLGAKRGSTGNLRTGAEAMGNAGYSDMRVFAGIIENWRAEVQSACAAELKALGLIG